MKLSSYFRPAKRLASRRLSGAWVRCAGVIVLLCTLVTRRSIGDGPVSPDALAQSALAATLGDIKQEIAAGSNATIMGPPVIYMPKVPATAVPALAGSTGTGGLENLVKRSAFGGPFYPAANYDVSAPNRAANVSTAAVSLNGVSMPPARWNRSLFSAAAGLADL